MKSPSKKRTNKDAQWVNSVEVFGKILGEIFDEVFYGIKYQTIPLAGLMTIGSLLCLAVVFDLDTLIFQELDILFLYPDSYPSFQIYILILTQLPFATWVLARIFLRRRDLGRLQAACINAGLRNNLGKIPNFIFDRPIDHSTRMLRLSRAQLPRTAFVKAAPAIESALQIFIDDIVEQREAGTIDLIYAHMPMPEFVNMSSFNLTPDTFVIGKTRSEEISATFESVPHLLIAGQTGGGKSTFARQLICSLYLSNPKYRFVLVDLKGGLEFQTFAKLDRINVIANLHSISGELSDIDRQMNLRFSIMKENGCKDLAAYRKIPKASRKKPIKCSDADLEFDRLILVVDEIAELFLANVSEKFHNAAEAKAVLSRVARLGRAVGIHLIAGTQRPDARVLDTQIKSNLPGKICFQMGDIHSSMVVLGNARAKYLPAVAGRAIWQCGMSLLEVQVPYVSTEDVDEKLGVKTKKI
ncbi:MAG: DNA translocase FtsK [Oligoflexales bacterium]|nr:DNA translocase FtsK [Oligoflexales bacterium]